MEQEISDSKGLKKWLSSQDNVMQTEPGNGKYYCEKEAIGVWRLYILNSETNSYCYIWE